MCLDVCSSDLVWKNATYDDCVFDMMNIFLRARSFNPANWKKGYTVKFPIADGKNRTPAQKASLEDLLYSLVLDYPDAEILGHRDLPWVRKSCPCFDVKEWLKEIDFHL